MKPKYLKTLAVILALTILAAIAVSQTAKRSHMHGAGMFGGPMLSEYIHRLDLTDAQQAQVRAIMQKEKPSVQPLMMQMAQGHAQLRDLVINSNGAFDEAKVRELASQQSQNVTELMVQYARIGTELVQVLTPEQKTKLNALIAEHQQRMMNHMQGTKPEQTPNQ
jgi:Spy/CpxP family protein refolding chaperone